MLRNPHEKIRGKKPHGYSHVISRVSDVDVNPTALALHGWTARLSGLVNLLALCDALLANHDVPGSGGINGEGIRGDPVTPTYLIYQ